VRSASLLRPLAIASFASLLLLASAVRADAIDPNVPSVIVVGPPDGVSSQSRGDATRSGRTDAELPAAPAELWRRNLSTIEMSPVVDATGGLIVVTASGDAVKIGADGKEAWRTHVQGGGPTSAPTILSDGTIGIITTGGTFTGLTPEGKVRFSTALAARGPDLLVPPVSADDGGVVILAARSLLTLDADGVVTSETLVPMRASTPPLPTPDGWLVVCDDGSVVRVRPPKQPTRVGRFDGPLDAGAVLADERTLLGVQHERLVALDLKTGLASTRASINATSSINPPVAVGANGSAYFTTSDGLLFGVDRSGQEEFRATVERVSQASTQPMYGQPYGGGAGYPGGYYPGAYPQYGGYGMGYMRPDPPLVIDHSGHFGFVRASGRFGMVEIAEASPPQAATAGTNEKRDPSRALVHTRVTVTSDHVCPTPIAVLPTGKKRVAVVCREGTIVEYGE